MKAVRRYLKKFISAALAFTVLAGSVAINAGMTASASQALPANIIVGYWHNFSNGSTTTKLRDVNENWDVINVSFMVTSGDRSTATFEPDSAIYSGSLEQRIAEFKSDVKYLQSRGKNVVISLGGETGSISLPNDAARDKFLNTSLAIIEEYGFDGFDVDLEGSSVTISQGDTIENCVSPIQVNIVYLLHQYKSRFGSDFIISMAPEHPYVQGGVFGWGSPWGAYLPFLNNCRDILTYIHPQYYNNAISYDREGKNFSGYNANSYVQLSEMLIEGFNTGGGFFEGLRPDQVAIGVPAGPRAAGSGVADVSEYQSALRTLLQKYPDFRGIMTWSTNWDEVQGNKFVLGMRSVIDQYGDTTMGISSLTANVSGEISVGEQVTWSASVKNAEGAVQYQFELYRNNSLIETRPYSSSNTYSPAISQAGEYYVKVTARDSSNTASRNSDVITAVIGELNIISVTSDKSGVINLGESVRYTAAAAGGLAPLTYAFDVYSGGTRVSQGAFSSSNVFTFTPSQGGTYYVTARVKDSQNTTKSMSSSSVFVLEPLTAVSVSATASGSSVNVNFVTSGGETAPDYYYYLLKGGQVFRPSSVNGGNAVFSSLEAGTYMLRAYAQDGVTRVVKTTNVTVR